jgi:formylglycine-generating enzyme required for sulfatase activity
MQSASEVPPIPRIEEERASAVQERDPTGPDVSSEPDAGDAAQATQAEPEEIINDEGDAEPHFSSFDAYTLSSTPSRRKAWLLIPVVALVVLILIAGAGVWYWRVKHRAINTAKTSPSPSSLPTPTPSAPQPPLGMVFIPGGTFSMGRDEGDEYERPVHEVTVDPFFMDKHEVTCAEYQRFVNEKGYPPPKDWKNGKYPADSAELPVTGVSWTDAMAFSQWAKKRLPTEEEWEFAARGYDGRLYPWGNVWNPQAANAGAEKKGGLAKVESFPEGESPFGIQDMAGNAWEWTDSQLKAYPGSKIKEDNLSDGERRNFKVIRGGSYQSNPNQATATYRMGWMAQGAPSYAQSGFRCAKDAR